MAISKKIESSLSGASFIRKMFDEGERLRKIYGPEKVYDFSLGNPSGEPPMIIKERLKNLALEPIQGMHRYMSNAGYADTRQAVADYLTGQTGLPFTGDHVVMTCGAGGALNVVLKTLLDPGDEVIALAPFFMEYKFYTDNHGGILTIAPTDENFMLDIKAIEDAITSKTKAIIVNSPNNPTGVVYNADSLSVLGELLKEKEEKTGQQIFVISDEPYAKIVYDNITVPSVFKYIKNSIAVTSHSKDLSLPGERIGYLAASPNIENVKLFIEGAIFCNRTLGFVNAPALAQRLVTGLQGESAGVDEYREKRDILFDNLTAMGYQMVKPQGAFYLFPKSPLPDDVEFVKKAQEYNILVVPGTGFARPGYFRMSYSVDKQMILNSLPAFNALARELGLQP